MLPAESIIYALQRNWDMVDSALEGLDEAAMVRQPSDQCNSAAWILWHMTRVVDMFIHTRLRSIPQLWTQDGWHEKFHMPEDGEDRGVGWTAEQVAAWQAPSSPLLLGYFEATKAEARKYLDGLSDADLDTTRIVPPATEPRSVSEMLGILLYDNIVHGGQIAFLRGYFEGRGWFTP